MANDNGGTLQQLTPAQRTIFQAMKHSLGGRIGLTDDDLLYAVRRMFGPLSYQGGKIILRAGQCLDVFTILGSGLVKVTCTDPQRKRSVIVQMVGAGHAFGLPSLAHRTEARRFGATAHASSLVGLLTPDALKDVFNRLDTARRLRVLDYGWNASMGLLLEKRVLLSLSVRERVWHVLSRLAARFPTSTGGPATPGAIAVALTQSDIGQLVGATRSTVNRQLRALSEHVVSVRPGHYVVQRPAPSVTPASFSEPAAIGGSSLTDDRTQEEVQSYLRQQAEAMGFPRAAVQAFAAHARLVAFAPGEQIALRDRSEALSLLITGAARVEWSGPTGEPLTLLLAKPGWLIPGGTARDGKPRCRVVAQVESCAAIISGDGFAHVVNAMTAAEFLHFLSFGWRVLSHHARRMCLLLMMREQERVWHQIDQLAHDFGAAHELGTIIDLDLSAADIGRLVGMEESAVRRRLRQLVRKRRIAVLSDPNRRIVVLQDPNVRRPRSTLHGRRCVRADTSVPA